ncbi:MAG: DUF11 domain-containing protein [Rhodanobacteraceae bacterium]|nr:DUF11 domain-containing protein [Rhodanobacteraceae bacterium]
MTSAGAFTCTGALQCTLPAGTPPGTYAVSYTATVKASASGSVANNVTATGGSPTDPTCTSCSTTHPLKDPAISVVKSSDPASGTAVAAGDTITYTLTATVSQAALTSPLVLTDALSANQTFGSVTSPGAFTCSGSLQCTLPIGTLPGTYAVSYTATVKANASGSVGNSVVATGGSPTDPACTACSTTHPLKDPAISVVKSSDPASGTAVAAGDTITYTLTATVSQAALTSPLVLTDALSANQTFGSVTSPGAFTCSGSLQCTLPIGTLPGTYAVSYTATVKANASGSVGNSVVATGGSPTDPACTACSTTHPLKDPAISVVKSSDPASGTAVAAGDTITYTLTATVSQAALTSPLVLTDALSANQTFGSVTSPGAFTCSGSLQCTLPIGTLPGTYAVSYTATVKANASGSVGNSVAASGGSPIDPSCTACSTTHPLKDPLISVAKASDPASGTAVAAGQTITYTLTATVSQAALTSPLVLTDTLSANQTFGSVTSAGSFSCIGTGPVVCGLPAGTVPGTYAVSYTATVNANASGSVGNSVAASGGSPTDPTCGTCSTTHPLKDPLISVAKASNPASGTAVAAGDTITYTLTATVSQAALTSNLVLTDTLGAGLTFGSVTSAGAYTADSSAAPVLKFTLPSGTTPGTYAVSYTATVKASASAGTVKNAVTAAGGSPTDPTCTTCSTTHPLKDPAISVVKASNPASGTAVAAGDTITYTLTATVSQAALTSNLVLTDTLGAGLTFGSVTSAGAYTADSSAAPVLKFTLPSGTTPGTYAVSYTATVKASASAGTVKNAVTAAGGSPTDPTCTTCSTTHPLKDPAISVVKASNPASGTAVAAGDTITYTLTATVSQAALTSNLVLTDTLGAGLTFGSVTSAGAYTADSSAAPVLKFTLPSGTTPGTYAVSYTATVKASASAGTVKNAVTAAGGSPTDPTCTSCSTTHPLKNPAISVAKASNPASGTAVAAGETITFTLTATVTDAALTSNLVLTDTLGAGLTFGTVTSAGSYAPDTSAAPVLKFTLPAGTTPGTYAVSYTATVKADAAGTVKNAVTAAGGSPTDPTCTSCSTTHPLKNPAISVAKTSNPASGTAVARGDTITYTLTATIADAALTSPFVLTDTLGAGLTFGSVTSAGDFTCFGTGPIVCGLPAGTVPGTYAVTYTATVDANATGSVGNNVAASGGSDTPPTCGSCSTTHPLVANVTLVKTLSGESGTRPGVAEPGETLTYTIALSNSGGVAATSVGVTDPLDANTTFVSATNGGSHAAGVVSWSGLTVPAGGTLNLSVTVKVVAAIPPGVTRIANVAYLTGSTPPACPPSGPQCVVTPTAANVSVTKALSGESIAADGVAEPGEQLTYTLTVRNEGGTATTGTIVNEAVPPHTTFVSGAPAWTCAAGAPAGTACAALVDVPAHDGTQPGVATLTFTVRVDDPLPSGVTSIANAVALNDGPLPDCVALPTAPACAVVPTVNVRMTKTVDAVVTTGPAAFRVSYRIEVVNLGGAPATYTLTDTLGFAPGVVFTGNAQVATTGGTLNPALAGGQFVPANGTIVQLSASNVGVAPGATHGYIVTVPVGVQAGALQDGACTGAPGHGLYNAAALGGTFSLESAACAPVDGDIALIRLVKTVTLGQDFNGNRYGDVGDVLDYHFTISNPGTVPLTAVQLFDPRVQSLQCNPLTTNGVAFRVMPGDELFHSAFDAPSGGVLAPGDSIECSATYALTADDVARRRVVNSATATGTGPAGQTVSSVGTAIFTSFR